MNLDELPKTIYGEWWEKDSEEKYFGVFHTDTFELTTSHWGKLSEFFDESQIRQVNIIYGRTSEGKAVSLLDNQVHSGASSNFNVIHEDTLTNDRIYPTWLVMDAYVDGNVTNFEFETYLTKKYLKDECRIDPSYQLSTQEILESTLPTKVLPFADNISIELDREILISENFVSEMKYKPKWLYKLNEPIEIYSDSFIRALRQVTGYISLLLNQFDSLKSISVYLPVPQIGIDRPHSIYLTPDHPLSRKINSDSYHRFPVFKYEKHNSTMFENYIKNEVLQDSLRNIFAHDYQDSYLEELLVTVCAAIQVFFTSCEPNKVKWKAEVEFKEIKKNISALLKQNQYDNEIRKKFNESFHNEISLRNIFEYLCKSNEVLNDNHVSYFIIEQVIGNLVKNRNKAAHGDPIDPADLNSHIRYIRAHFIMYTLKYLGANISDINPHDIRYHY